MKAILGVTVAALTFLAAGTALADQRQTNQSDDSSASSSGQGQGHGQSSSSSSSSSTTAPAGPEMKDLLDAGYEVKSVMLIPADIVKRGGNATAVDAIMISLQNGQQFATCYEEFTAFTSDPTTVECNEFNKK